ncbi:MAG: ABC transporter substrate-binding protein [Thermoplasmata archaeon]|nr:ABC transporter substrate-binding protein [Thermoplasmata archaeon]
MIAVAIAIPIAAVTDTFIGKADAASDGGTLRMGYLQKVDSLNPNVGLVDAAYVFYGLVYDTIQCVDKDLNIVGNIVLNSTVDETYEPYGSVWEMDVTPHATWHDGEKVRVEDVVITINVMANNFLQMWAYQPYAYYMDYAEKVDSDTLRVHFYDRGSDEQDPMAAAYARMICIPVFPKHIVEDMPIADFGFNWIGATEGQDPPLVGSGPFMATENIVEEFTTGDKITLLRNPNYHWKAEKGLELDFDKLEMIFFNDAYAMALALEGGELDIAQFPPSEYLAIKDKVENGELEDIEVYDGPKCTQYWTEVAVCMSTGGPNPSRLDPVIRQAMAHATDKTYIVNNHYLGLADEGTTLIPPVNEQWHYEPTADEIYEFDLDVADALLEDGGYRYIDDSGVRAATADSYAVQIGLVPEGTKLKYEMAIRQEYPEERQIAIFLQEQWGEVGIEIEYDIMTEAALGVLVYSYEYDTMLWYWSADVDPMYQLYCQTAASFGGWNDNMYSTPSYEENFTASVKEFDQEKRMVNVDNMQRTHYLDAYYFILAYVYQTFAWRTDNFIGWGDWDAHPGLSADHFWSGAPLYFELEYIGGPPPEVPWLAIGAGMAVVVAAAVAAVVLKKRGDKKKPETEDSSPLGE